MNTGNERLWGPAPASTDIEGYRDWKGWWADGSEHHGRRLEPHEWAMSRALKGELCPGDIVEIEPFGVPPGTRRTIMNSGAPVRDAAGHIVGAVVAQADITRIVESETALRISEGRFRSTFENAAVGVAHVGLEGQWLRVNDRLCDIVGYRREELLAKTFQDITHPDDVAADLAEARRLLGGEVSTYSMEKRYIRKDGSVVPVLLTASLVLNDDGSPDYFIAVVDDITERKRTEAAVLENEAKFRALADNIPQLAWMADEHGDIFWYNRRWFEYSGSTPEAMEGWGWRDLQHPDHAERVTAKFRSHIANGQVWEDTFPLRGGDGQYRWFLSRAVPIRNDAGEITRWFGTNTDITGQLEVEHALRASEASLRRANEDLLQFASIGSHDLKEPLRGMSLLASFLAQEEAGRISQAGMDKLDRIRELCKRLTSMVNSLLEHARTGLDPKFAPCDMGDLIRRVVDTSREDFASRNCEVVITGPFPVVSADSALMERVLANLIANAFKFNESSTKRVEIFAEDEAIVLRDNGIGIDARHHEKIFRLFRRVHNPERYPGEGLGLALVKKIIDAHGGTIELESSLGTGTTFRLRLPKLDAGHPLHSQTARELKVRSFS
jgi:PAS domain S-box-containing protein